MVGVGGTKYFTFKVTDKAIAGSQCQIGFEEARPWELRSNWHENPEKKVLIKIN